MNKGQKQYANQQAVAQDGYAEMVRAQVGQTHRQHVANQIAATLRHGLLPNLSKWTLNDAACLAPDLGERLLAVRREIEQIVEKLERIRDATE